MTISNDGKKIASAFRKDSTVNGSWVSSKYGIELCDFDLSSGIISNPLILNTSTGDAVYGVAFSNNRKLLYANVIGSGSKLLQYNISLPTANLILASQYTVASAQYLFGAIQTGPDGKIYTPSTSTSILGAIQNSNGVGALCGYNPNVLNLNKNHYISMPNFLVDYLGAKLASQIQGDTSICNISSYYIKNNCGVDGDSIVWILHGNSVIISQIGDSITIKPTQTGTDTLISIQYATCGVVSDTLIIHTQTSGASINIGKDTTICNPNNLQLNAGAGFTNYLWSTTATTQNINVNTPGTYWVEVSDTSGCKSRDTIVVVQGNTKPNVNLGADKIVCPGKVIPLDAGAGYMNYNWFDNSNNQTNTAWLPGTYWVTVIDSCGNKSSDTIKVITDNSGAISLGSDTQLCDNETLTLDAGNGFISYLWQDGSTNQTYTVIDSGTYVVHVLTQDGCSYSDTIRIDDCIINVDDCEIGIPDAFSPNGDGMNDEFKVLGKCVDKITLVIYDRWGEKVFETTNPNQGWDGINKGKKFDNGVFAYYLRITTFKGTDFTYKGNISLIK